MCVVLRRALATWERPCIPRLTKGPAIQLTIGARLLAVGIAATMLGFVLTACESAKVISGKTFDAQSNGKSVVSDYTLTGFRMKYPRREAGKLFRSVDKKLQTERKRRKRKICLIVGSVVLGILLASATAWVVRQRFRSQRRRKECAPSTVAPTIKALEIKREVETAGPCLQRGENFLEPGNQSNGEESQAEISDYEAEGSSEQGDREFEEMYAQLRKKRLTHQNHVLKLLSQVHGSSSDSSAVPEDESGTPHAWPLSTAEEEQENWRDQSQRSERNGSMGRISYSSEVDGMGYGRDTLPRRHDGNSRIPWGDPSRVADYIQEANEFIRREGEAASDEEAKTVNTASGIGLLKGKLRWEGEVPESWTPDMTDSEEDPEVLRAMREHRYGKYYPHNSVRRKRRPTHV